MFSPSGMKTGIYPGMPTDIRLQIRISADWNVVCVDQWAVILKMLQQLSVIVCVVLNSFVCFKTFTDGFAFDRGVLANKTRDEFQVMLRTLASTRDEQRVKPLQSWLKAVLLLFQVWKHLIWIRPLNVPVIWFVKGHGLPPICLCDIHSRQNKPSCFRNQLTKRLQIVTCLAYKADVKPRWQLERREGFWESRWRNPDASGHAWSTVFILRKKLKPIHLRGKLDFVLSCVSTLQWEKSIAETYSLLL